MRTDDRSFSATRPRGGSGVRVAHLVTGDAMYGAERWVETLARNVDRRRVGLVVITVGDTDGHRHVHATYGRTGVEAIHVSHGGKLNFEAVANVTSLTRRHGIDVLHTHGFKADVLGYLAAGGMRRVSTLHGTTRGERHRIRAYEAVARFCLRRFDRLYPLSEWLRDELLTRGFPARKVRLIRNAVDVALFRTTYEARMRSSQQPTGVIAFLGRIVAQKGVFELVRAFATAKLPSRSRLLIVGDGPATAGMLRQCDRLGIRDRVAVWPFVEDVREVFRQSDVVVLPSHSEGIPRVLMEACAAGVPAIGSDIAGIRELIENERTGFLVPVGNSLALAAALERRYADEGLVRQMAHNARLEVERRFAASRQAAEFAAEYAALAEAYVEDPNPTDESTERIPLSIGR